MISRARLQLQPNKRNGPNSFTDRRSRRMMNKALLLLVLVSVGTGRLLAAQPDRSPKIVLISAESEYFSSNSLPAFKKFLETNFHFNCTYLQRTGSNDIPGLEALDS